MSEPRLGIWKVVKVERRADGAMFQITRNGENIGEPWVFKGHAVAAQMMMIRAEGLAVQENTRRSYER